MKILSLIQNMSQNERKLFYMNNVHSQFQPRALFSDATESYRSPAQPKPGQTVTIRIRTAKYNVNDVIMVANDLEYPMKRVESDQIFDYFEAHLQVVQEQVQYYFKILSGGRCYYYNQKGAQTQLDTVYHFRISPGFETPDWAKGAVFYQIFTDRFFDGNTHNNVKNDEYSYLGEHVTAVTDWNQYPENLDVRRFYGGDLKGVMDKLDYLQELGIEAIYFNPLFVSPSNHKYDSQDYDHIDPHFGVIISESGEVLKSGDHNNVHAQLYISRVTNKKNLEASDRLFIELVNQIHQRGMRVIIDGVFNHCGSFHRWMDRERIYSSSGLEYELGAYLSENSPYCSYFKFDTQQWPDNISYEGWWENETLPKLNFEQSQDLESAILAIATKWVSPPYCVDGWRLDVAADLGHSKEYNHAFWKKFRQAVKQANPEAVILAEHYGESYDWLQGEEWDTVMNYDAFMEPVTWFLTGMEKHSDEFRADMLGNAEAFFHAMSYHMARMGAQSYTLAMNELSNHDHSRFMTRTNRTVGRIDTNGAQAANLGIDKAVFMEAVVIQMTWPGAPAVYYGDEAGVCGWTDPDSRRTYPWGREDLDLVEFHKQMISLHKQNRALREGSYKQLVAQEGLIAYGRFVGEEAAIVVVNNADYERKIQIPVWEIGLPDHSQVEQVVETSQGTFRLNSQQYLVVNGHIFINIRKTSAVVLFNRKC